jgi:single-strand DNA-binding protein
MLENIQLIGNLTRDVELKELPTGASFYTCAMAVNKSKDKVVFYDFLINKEYGKKIALYLSKGTKVYLDGTPSLNVYKDKNGEAKASISVSVKTLKMLGGKQSQDNPLSDNVAPAVDNDIPF